MTKISNQYSLTNILTADLANSRLGINNVSPTVALDVTGAGKFSGVLTLGSTISNGTFAYTLPGATGTLALTSALSGTTNYVPKFTSSTAIGNSIIFDNGTNVGIGTTTPSYKLSVVGPVLGNAISWTDTANNTGYLGIRGASASIGADNNLVFETAATERMRITSSGNVGIGTSSPGNQLVLAQNNQTTLAEPYLTFRNLATGYGSWAIWKRGGNDLAFYYGVNTDVPSAGINMTLRYGGVTEFSSRVLVNGEVWGTEYLGVIIPTSATAGTGVTAYYNGSSYTGSLIRVQAETAPSTSWYGYELRSSGGTIRYGIYGNGTVTAPSDERRKKNIETTRDGYLQDVCNLRVVKYNWKDDEEGKNRELGFIAQEVEKVFPKLVETGYDGLNNENEVKLLKQGVFVPILVKAIQELSAKVSLLENK